MLTGARRQLGSPIHRGSRSGSREVLLWLAVFALSSGGLATRSSAQNAITLTDVTITDLAGTPGTVLISSDAPVTSVFLSIQFDSQQLAAGSIEAAGAAIDAEGVFPNIFQSAGGLIVGLILDVTPPFAGQTIPPGIDLPILTIAWSISGAIPTSTVTTPIGFVDGVFDSPPVTNTITQSGVGAITVANGLSLVGGTVTIEPPVPPTFRVMPTVIPASEAANVAIRLDNPTGPIEAFFLALVVPPELEVAAFETAGTILEAVGAEFLQGDLTQATITYNGIVDSDAPFDGQTIPLGNALAFVFLATECLMTPLEPEPPLSVVLDWRATPNPSQIVSSGETIIAITQPGLITCLPAPLGAATFLGGQLDGTGDVGSISAAPGDTVEYGFFYTDPSDGIEGLQIAACLECDQAFFVPGSFTAIGDRLDEAEFVQPSYESDPFDGDGCEFTLGALLDASPPFDGATLPLSSTPLRLGTVEITIDPSVAPSTSITVEFCNGINGSGTAQVNNLVIVSGASIENFTKLDGMIVLDLGNLFRRGDVNHDGSLNVADPVATLQYLFASGVAPECLAAADIDASGVILLNDPILALDYLFVGGPPPAAPFPDCGSSSGEVCDTPGSCP